MNDKKSWRGTHQAWPYLMPAMMIVAVFGLYPVIQAFDLSLHVRYDYYRNLVFERGWDNFSFVFQDPEFRLALRNTLLLIVSVVPASMVASLAIAYFLHTRRLLSRWLQPAFFLPLVASVLAAALAWRWLFHTEYGLANATFAGLGLPAVGWLTSPEWAMPSLVLFSVWHSLGYNVLLFLVGLQAIPPQYDRAARIDGASRWPRFRRITLPMLRRVLYYVSIVSVVHAFMTFDEVFALFGGERAGPMDRALTVVYYVFRKFYSESEYGIASAAAYAGFLLVFALTLVQLKMSDRRGG
ncbi:ABC transporter permease [Cohnella sp. CIP 111063]|uniref:carbohydrate ABC transporter permease n=1 Tax=unclassified Cohnella TaxID=2636738 RepID=UPI000B8C6A6A|nr:MULTISPECIES: sugar ABC transporter permease [unclassified Cohnella]OXS59891.1 ABC transporter permease [Cohnella sp. CIP 111063]PRX72693.1 carbohydrate ABC transporter membrane protein 1 (CUT1 family) [Cohnella sp. SGD-V74]